jgi:hypothetical protein
MQMKSTCNYKRCFAEYFVFFPTFVEKIALSIFLVRILLLCLFPSLVNCVLLFLNVKSLNNLAAGPVPEVPHLQEPTAVSYRGFCRQMSRVLDLLLNYIL